MLNYDLEHGFKDTDSDTAKSKGFETWVTEFPTYRTHKLKNLLASRKIEATEFTELESVISAIPDKQVQDNARFFDVYKAWLPVKDLETNQAHSIPIMLVMSKGGGASSSALSIPMCIAEIYVMENMFPNATSKIIGVADLSKTRLSAAMTSDQIGSIVKLYRLPNFYKQITIHFLGMGFINSMLALLGRVSQDTKTITSKVVITSNVDGAIVQLADLVKEIVSLPAVSTTVAD
jgi:hypothetical protein